MTGTPYPIKGGATYVLYVGPERRGPALLGALLGALLNALPPTRPELRAAIASSGPAPMARIAARASAAALWAAGAASSGFFATARRGRAFALSAGRAFGAPRAACALVRGHFGANMARAGS